MTGEARIAMTQRALERAACPLPGSIPATNSRPLRIPGRLDATRLRVALGEMFPHVGLDEWKQLVEEKRLLSPSGQPADLEKTVRSGQQFQRIDFAEIEPAVNGRIRIIHLDEALMVLNKPAPLPVHPCGRFHRNTLLHILKAACHPAVPRPVHRLDANTTGTLLCSLSPGCAGTIQAEFARGTVQKRYLAVINGHPEQDEFTVDAPIRSQPAGGGLHDVCFKNGAPSLTEFVVLQRRKDGTGLIEARPVTGRANQIRIHLWQMGFPVVGDPSYLPNHQRAHRQTLALGDPAMKLHSWKIRLTHPATRQIVEFSCDPPWNAGCAVC